MSTSIEEKKKIPAALLEAAHDASSVGAGDVDNLQQLGYSPVLRRNRSMWTLLFQAVAIAAPPFGIGGRLLNAVYGGGQLSLFIGWIVVAVLAQCVALPISELASRYPTSAGPYYRSYQLASSYKTALSFITGWTWLIGNWSSTTSVNFGFASLIASAITMYNPD
ncbi:hypothetical protein CEP54_013799 [Fusarium duplospermum]|uniref:Amino acid permease n=1 Tax=Fusarium duplospermum TaxID=1325734 RepID=A0A428P0J5_9HYPO|nr:hypothetical protein CEP54_013799 [Fusarium duplospermum]